MFTTCVRIFRGVTTTGTGMTQLVQPSNLNGLTNNHNWATVRRMGSLQLVIHATQHLRFTAEYFRNTRDGVSDTTRSLDYFGASSTRGLLLWRNPFYVIAPFDAAAQRGTGGVDYARGDWAVHYRLGYQRFTDSVRGNNVTSPERSLNVDDAATAKEPVNNLTWNDSRKLSTPVSELLWNGALFASRPPRRIHVLSIQRTGVDRHGIQRHREDEQRRNSGAVQRQSDYAGPGDGTEPRCRSRTPRTRSSRGGAWQRTIGTPALRWTARRSSAA